MSETTVTGWDVLDEARSALRRIVAGVPADGWARPTPCSAWTASQVLQHAALDQRVWAAAVAGTEMPGEDPFAPSGQLGAEALAYADQALEASASPWAALDRTARGRTARGREGEPVPTPLPQGPMTAPEAAAAAALDAAIHAWDIAVATGQVSPLTPELARALTPVARAIVEPLRAWGAYAEARPAGPAAPDDAALLAYLGRRPDWTTPAA